MAQMLNIGKRFEDFSSLEIAIQQYQKEENAHYVGPTSVRPQDAIQMAFRCRADPGLLFSSPEPKAHG